VVKTTSTFFNILIIFVYNENKMEMNQVYFTITIGLLGILFAALQYRLAYKRRKDDLFRLRFKFYKDLSKIWTSTSNLDIIPILNIR
jgi:hypothetical protein